MVEGFGDLNGSGNQQVWISHVRTSQSQANNTSTFHYEIRYYGNGYGSFGNSGSWSVTTPYFYRDGTWSIPQGDAYKTYTVLATGDYTVQHNASGQLGAFNVRGAIDYNHSSIGKGEVNLTEPASPNIQRTPGQVASLTLSNATATGMTATWTAPAANGSAITGYEVRWSTKSDMSGATVVTVGNVLTTNLTGMAPQTTYYVKVRAKNAIGSGADSAAKSLTTLPSVPPGLTVTASPSGTAATLVFTPPGGVTGVTKYTFERRVKGTTTPVTSGTTNTTVAEVTGLTPGETYEWRGTAWIGSYQSPATAWITLKQPKPNTDPGDYFDGSTPDTLDLDYGWTGTANNSTSTAKGKVPTGWMTFAQGNPSPGATGSVYQVTDAAPVHGAITASTHSARAIFNTDQTAAGFAIGTSIAVAEAAQVTENATYVGSIYVKTSKSTLGMARIAWLDAAGTILSYASGVPTVTAVSTWERMTVTGAAPAGAVAAAVWWVTTTGTGYSAFLSGDTVSADAAMLSLNEDFGYFDGASPDTEQYTYDWKGNAHASPSTRTVATAAVQGTSTPAAPSGRALVDPDCATIPDPPRPPNIDNSCIDDTGIWRRYYVSIPSVNVPDWLSAVPTLEVHSGSFPARQVRIRYYPNPFDLPESQVNTSEWCAEQIISYMPPLSVLTLDGVTQRTWAEVNGGDAVSADHLLYGSNGQPATWPILSCGISYLVSLEVPTDAPEGNIDTLAYLTTRS